MRFHTQTAGVSLTAQQPEVNLIRTAIEALAAVLGGTQSLHTNSFDEALALPTENAVRLALRTQQVIAHEIGAVNTIDPLGGSYYVEHLTNELERQAYEYFDRIEKLGGVIPAIEENFMQREIAEASYRYQSEVEAKQRIDRRRQPLRARGRAADRDPPHRPRARAAADRARPGTARPPRLGRGRAGARAAQGRRRPRRPQPDGADHGRLTRLRDDGRDVRRPPRRLGRLARDAGLLDSVVMAGKIRVVIAKPGLDGHDRGAKIIARALRDAGMEVIYTGLHQTPEQIVETAIQEDADAVGISILSGAHMTLVPRILELLRENGAEDVLVVVGGTVPADDADELKQLGVADVFGPGAPTSDDRRLPQGRGARLSDRLSRATAAVARRHDRPAGRAQRAERRDAHRAARPPARAVAGDATFARSCSRARGRRRSSRAPTSST